MINLRSCVVVLILAGSMFAHAHAEQTPLGCFRSDANPTECWEPSDNTVTYEYPMSDSAEEFHILATLYGNAMAQVIFDKYQQEIQCSKDTSSLKTELDSVLAQQGQLISGFLADYDRISGNLTKALKKNRTLRAKLKRLKRTRR